MTQVKQTREKFLSTLAKSGLLSGAELGDLAQKFPVSDRALSRMVKHLLETNRLTKFQLTQLVEGKYKGFQIGQYLITDQLGRGGLGRVFKAVHKTMNREVAIKILAPELLKTERARLLFQREVQATGKLLHPNIVTAYDASTSSHRYFLVMEFVNGQNLEKLVKSNGPIPAEITCEIIRQCALGLGHAHSLGMLHRDVKPANLLLQVSANQQWQVKIADFGLARLGMSGLESNDENTIVTKKNTVMGTPDFLSPEQARNLHEVDCRSDLYSLGCTMYFLLSGQVPFPEGNSMQKLLAHFKKTATPIEEWVPNIDPSVAGIVRKLMEKNPDNRFQNTGELIDAITPFAKSCAINGWSKKELTRLPKNASPPEETLANNQNNSVTLVPPIVTDEFSLPKMGNSSKDMAAPTYQTPLSLMASLTAVLFCLVVGVSYFFFSQ